MLLNDAPASVTSSRSGTALLRLALVGWVVIAVANLIYYASDLASDYADMPIPCPGMLGSGGECNFLSISDAEMATLSAWGLTPHAYATAMTISPLILLAVYWALGGLILAAVVETVATTLKLPFVANETVGRLIVSPRSSGEQFTAYEQQLLADIAGQIGPAASATRLARESARRF